MTGSWPPAAGRGSRVAGDASRPVVDGHGRPNSGRSILLRPSQIVKQMCQCLFACLLAQTHVVEFAFR
jgi:hypothetical protein